MEIEAYIVKRVKTSLESIGLKHVRIESYSHYQQQGEMLHDIINNYTGNNVK